MNPVDLLIFLIIHKVLCCDCGRPIFETRDSIWIKNPIKIFQCMDPHPCLYVCKAMPNYTEKVINRNKKEDKKLGGRWDEGQ